MTFKQHIIQMLLVAVVAVVAMGFFLHLQPEQAPKAGDVGTSLPGALTAASVSVTSASTQVLATSTGRIYAAIVNDGTSSVYLAIGTAAVAGTGILLTPGGSYEINGQNPFTGAVAAITTSGTSNVTLLYK